MKRFSVFLCTISMVFAVVGAASAVPITDFRDFDPDIELNRGDTFAWQLDIRDDGFDPGSQDVMSATLTLRVWDDGDGHEEWARLIVGGVWIDTWEVNTEEVTFDLTSFASVITSLSDDGYVDATLTATDVAKNDFGFNWSQLDVEATDVESPVHTPEPATMLLLGTGLVGMAALGRMKSIRKRWSMNSLSSKA